MMAEHKSFLIRDLLGDVLDQRCNNNDQESGNDDTGIGKLNRMLLKFSVQ